MSDLTAITRRVVHHQRNDDIDRRVISGSTRLFRARSKLMVAMVC